MRQAGTDRRAMRTQQLLVEALVGLMHTKRYSAISVREITDAANVGRSTFYAHFTDKEDLLALSVRQMVGSLEQDVPGPRNTLAPSLGLFHHVAEIREVQPMMARRHLNLFLDVLQAELSALFVERLAPRVQRGKPTVVPVPLLAAMTAGMLITAVRTWAESGMSPTAEEVNRSFTVAAEAALRAGLRAAE
jgi:AcrR family transcriptional regulator